MKAHIPLSFSFFRPPPDAEPSPQSPFKSPADSAASATPTVDLAAIRLIPAILSWFLD